MIPCSVLKYSAEETGDGSLSPAEAIPIEFPAEAIPIDL